MASSYFTKAVTQKKSNGKMLQKYAAHSQKNTYADMWIQLKPGGNHRVLSPPPPPLLPFPSRHKNTSA